MLLKLQQAIIGLNARAEQSSMFRTLRSTLVSGAAFFRTPSNATTAIAGMMEIEAKHRAETESWVNPEALASGKGGRSEEHTSELQSLMRISYAVFCLKKKTYNELKLEHPHISEAQEQRSRTNINN